MDVDEVALAFGLRLEIEPGDGLEERRELVLRVRAVALLVHDAPDAAGEQVSQLHKWRLVGLGGDHRVDRHLVLEVLATRGREPPDQLRDHECVGTRVGVLDDGQRARQLHTAGRDLMLHTGHRQFVVHAIDNFFRRLAPSPSLSRTQALRPISSEYSIAFFTNAIAWSFLFLFSSLNLNSPSMPACFFHSLRANGTRHSFPMSNTQTLPTTKYRWLFPLSSAWTWMTGGPGLSATISAFVSSRRPRRASATSALAGKSPYSF